MRMFFHCNYRTRANISRLYDRRSNLCTQLFNNISNNVNGKLFGLLPSKAVQLGDLRLNGEFNTALCKTNRLKNGFFLSHYN